MFKRAAVKTHEISGFAEHRCKLVHNAAVHSAIVVLGRLAYQRKLKLVDLIGIEHIIKRKSKAAFQRRRWWQAGTKRHIAREYCIEAFHFSATLYDFTAHAEYISCPLLWRSISLFQSELRIFIDIHRVYSHFVSAIGLYLSHYHFVDSSGEYESAIVIGMLSYEVYASGRSVHLTFVTEMTGELIPDCFFHVHIEIVF